MRVAKTAGPHILPANTPKRPVVAAIPHADQRVPAESATQERITAGEGTS